MLYLQLLYVKLFIHFHHAKVYTAIHLFEEFDQIQRDEVSLVAIRKRSIICHQNNVLECWIFRFSFNNKYIQMTQNISI